jgi:hypothetical protein
MFHCLIRGEKYLFDGVCSNLQRLTEAKNSQENLPDKPICEIEVPEWAIEVPDREVVNGKKKEKFRKTQDPY